MSFADFAVTTPPSRPTTARPTASSLSPSLSSSSRPAIDKTTFKLDQFQRQVQAIKRAAQTSTNAVDDDLHDRIRFACLLQEEIATAFTRVSVDASNSLIKRKLGKDFQSLSTELESAIQRVSDREQTLQEARKDQHEHGRIVAELPPGQVVEFAELEAEIAHNEALIQEREADLHQIHQSVAQVNEIFRDLAAMVQDQQGAIEEIEAQVEESRQQTHEGLKQVQKASDMQGYCLIQ